MFGKLLKNDLKAQWFSMSTIFLVMIISAIAVELLTVFSDNKAIKALGGGVVMAIFLFACLFILFAVGSAFSKTMFGRAGYLTMSLPVKTGKLILSKTVSGLIWTFTVYALFIGSFALWVMQVYDVLGEQMIDSVESLLSVFGVPSVETVSLGIIVTCISLASVVLVMVQSIFFAETVSHVSPVSKLGKFGAIVIFFAVFILVIGIASRIATAADIGIVITDKVFSVTANMSETRKNLDGNSMTIELTSTLVRIILSIALHFPIVKLVKDKVNLA